MRSHVSSTRASLRRVFLICLVFLFPCWESVLAADPVQVFIARADSLVRAGDAQGLVAVVVERSVIVGAAVGAILDAAVDAGDSGDTAGEQERLAFAERLSVIYKEKTGSSAPLDLVATYRGFTPEQRSLRREAKGLEAQARTARQSGNLTGAAESLEEAKRIYREIHDGRSEAIVWGSLGVVQFLAIDFGAAEKSYMQALEARRRIDDRILEGLTLNALGSVQLKTKSYTAALDYYRQAIALRTETGDLAGLGTSLTYMGATFYEMRRLGDALDAYASGLEILEAVGNPTQLFENLNGFASVYSRMDRLQSSNEMFLRALGMAHEAGNLEGEIACRNNLVLNLNDEYRFSEALEQLDVIESLLPENRDPQLTIEFYRNRGLTYRNIGDTDKARESLLACVEEAEKHRLVTNQFDALLLIGYLYRDLGAYDRGLQSAEKARTLAEGELSHRIGDAAALTAELECLLGRYDQALAHWETALEQHRLLNSEVSILEDELGIANVHAAAGRSDAARAVYSTIGPRIASSGQVELVLSLNLGIGDSYEKTQPDSAFHYYETALWLLEERRATLQSDAVRSDFLSGARRRYYYEEIARYYASVAQATPDGDWSARAFRTVERAKARGLLDLLEVSQRSRESATETALLDSLYRLDKTSPDYEAQRRNLQAGYETARDARLESSLRGLSNADLAGIEDVRKTLSKGTVLLAYALGDSASLLWAIDRKGHELFLLPSRSVLQIDIQRLRDAMAVPGRGDAALRRSARRLYEALVLPAEPRLAKNRKLVIVPDGALFEIPFEVLLTRAVTDETPWHELPFLASSFSPIYAPSVSVFVNMAHAKKSATHDLDLLAVGDPDFSTLAEQVGRAPLDSLPYTRAEVLSISANLKDDRKNILLGRDANEAHVKRTLKQTSPRLLHLATHGLVDPAEPAASSIALGTDDVAREDGYLDTMEILALSLDVDLVVLSACESARGRVGRSEGVVGLSRAFIASGAHGIVASLWAVSDESTSVLMDEFYKKMMGKKRPAGEALNEARFALMSNPDYAHPFYWSPFIVIGSERSPW